ncbi:MAG: hypothetical protein ABFD24_08705 [Anaerolineaceae bacterium]
MNDTPTPRIRKAYKVVRNGVIGALIISLSLASACCASTTSKQEVTPIPFSPMTETFTPLPTSTVVVLYPPTKEIAPTTERTSLYRVMEPEEMKARDLYGYGVEITGNVEGVSVTVYFVQTDQLIAKFKEAGYSPLYLNPMMGEISELNSAQRISRAVLIADYEGFLQDKGFTNQDYSFGQYVEDLKNEKDRSYVIYSLNNRIIVDPMKPHEFVFGYGIDMKNGMTFNTGPGTSMGSMQCTDGGNRIVFSNTFLEKKSLSHYADGSIEENRSVISTYYTNFLKQMMEYFSFQELAQQGKPVDGDRYYMDTNLDTRLRSTPMFTELNNLLGDPSVKSYYRVNVFMTDIVK